MSSDKSLSLDLKGPSYEAGFMSAFSFYKLQVFSRSGIGNPVITHHGRLAQALLLSQWPCSHSGMALNSVHVSDCL